VKHNLELAHSFYYALQSKDGIALKLLLHPNCEGHLTEGLPNGLGGTYRGPIEMLQALMRVGESFSSQPQPTRFLIAESDHVVVQGRYRGESIQSGKPLDAAFLHVLRFREERLLELWQVTDSQRWADALA
jgi:2-(1,2-epoxy-1,2-dihydrophenyl)acetyl-CoA isomerase